MGRGASGPQGEWGAQETTRSGETTHKAAAGEVVRIGRCPQIFQTGAGSVRDGEEIRRENHFSGHASAEILDLAADVAQEGVTGPPANEHDGVDWDTSQIHCHGCPGSDGVGSDVLRGESQLV